MRPIARKTLRYCQTLSRNVSKGGSCMETSARNQLRGTVKSVSIGAVMAEVIVDVNGIDVVAAITKDPAERLGLASGCPRSRSSRRPTS